MSIIWVDPYIESPSGGVDGTTGVGTLGSYSNPYSLNNTPSTAADYTVVNEIRLKSLPANPWLAGPQFHNAANYNGYGVGISSGDVIVGSLNKYTSRHGEDTFLSWNSSGSSINSYPNPWNGCIPGADPTNLVIHRLDPQYYLTSKVNDAQEYLLSAPSTSVVTVTAGWVSEVARGGSTIIHHFTASRYDQKWFWNADQMQNLMNVDAPELSITLSVPSSQQLYIYGDTVTIGKVVQNSAYSYGVYINILSASKFTADTVSNTAYISIYPPAKDNATTNGVANRDIRLLSAGYFIRLKSPLTSVYTQIELRFKDLTAYYIGISWPLTGIKLHFYDNFFIGLKGGLSGSFAVSEMALDPLVNFTTDIQYAMTMHSFAPTIIASSNSTDSSRIDDSVQMEGSYLSNGVKLNTQGNDVYFKSFMPPVGVQLEQLTYNNVKWMNTYSHGMPAKAWSADYNSGRAIAFLAGATNNTGYQKDGVMMYNSTEYGGQLVYHFMAHEPLGPGQLSTVYYRERFAADLPAGVAQLSGTGTYRIKITLGGTPQGEVLITDAFIAGNNTTESQWRYPSGGFGTYAGLKLNSASGGEDTVLYTGNIGTFKLYLEGMTTISIILQMSTTDITTTSKICLKSVELVEV